MITRHKLLFMKYVTHFSRFFVGVLFIFSGLVKLNDPVGFSFKLEEYFETNVLNLPFFIPYALGIALFVVIFEVILGVLLLLGHYKKFTVWSLLGMIVFFTFLTFYSAYFNKVTDCGCFGDAIPLTPWQSFYKDVILLVFIVILYVNQQYITVLGTKKAFFAVSLVSLLGCLAFAYHVLNHLPVKDFRAYKVGTNIEEGMQIPEGAPKPVYELVFYYDVDGVRTEFSYEQAMGGEIPENASFLERTEKLIKEGFTPPIKDFSIEREGNDFTEEVLQTDKVMIFVMYQLSKSSETGLKKLENLHKKATAAGYLVIALTASLENEIVEVSKKYGHTFDYYFCDATTLKTIERANPSIVILERGTITQKWHHNDISKIQF